MELRQFVAKFGYKVVFFISPVDKGVAPMNATKDLDITRGFGRYESKGTQWIISDILNLVCHPSTYHSAGRPAKPFKEGSAPYTM